MARLFRWGQRGTAGASIPKSLSFEGVRLAFGGAEVLRGIDLSVEPGETLALLGPSGCGKTSLLRVAAGLEEPTGGRVLLDGREVSGPGAFVPPDARGIGFVFQDYALFPHLTVLGNAMFGLRDLAPVDAAAQASRSLARVGLSHLRDAYPDRLSGGEQQRVALARAIAMRPGVLLMDEPFSNLDRRLRDAVRDETAALLREIGTSAVIVTHDPEEAMRVADRVALMRAGLLVQIGTPASLYREPADLFAARFFSDFNEVEGIVRAGRVSTPLGVFPAPGLAEGSGAVVCVRPQGVRLVPDGFCLPGRIVERRFLGEVEQIDVAVNGLDEPLRTRLRGAPAGEEGTDVGLDIAPDEVLVFPAIPA